MDDKLVEVILNEAKRIVEKYGLEVFDLTFRRESRGWVLRLTIDNPVGYVSIKDCELVSRELESWLDSEDLISHRYILEVSSPGLDRPLRNTNDFVRFTGKLAKVVFNDGSFMIGRIVKVEDEVITMKEGKKIKSFKFEDVRRANLEPEF